MRKDYDKERSMLASGKNVILLHSNADLDSAGSGATLSLHFGIENVIAPGGVSHLGKRLLSLVNIEVKETMGSDDYDRFIVVDAQDDSSLGYSGTQWDKALVIDHHKIKSTLISEHSVIEENLTSTCELVWDIIGQPEKISREMGLCLLSGIVSDTGHMRRGGSETFAAISGILASSGLSMEEVMVVFEVAEDQNLSRKMSRLKGAQRMRYERFGDWIVAISEIGAFESAVCNALLSLGADVAFAGSQKNEEFRITGRANSQALKAGIHLGDIFNRIASECQGEGGGHDGAAGLTGIGEAEALLDICMQNAASTLKSVKKERRNNEENVL